MKSAAAIAFLVIAFRGIRMFFRMIDGDTRNEGSHHGGGIAQTPNGFEDGL